MIEIIIAIVIILVLGAVTVPALLKYVARSKEAACKTNRASILTELNARQVEAMAMGEMLTKEQLQQLLADFPKQCPSGGTYEVHLTADDSGFDAISISCSAHEGKDGDKGHTPETVSHTFLDTFGNYVKNKKKKKKNDAIRNKFYEENGNKFPTITVDGKTYSIQPFYKEATGEVWLFATSDYSDATNSRWNVQMVYNPVDKKWYQATKYSGEPGGASSITFKDIDALNDAVHNDTHSNGKKKWVEVKDYTESK